jgi:hypothetical protein
MSHLYQRNFKIDKNRSLTPVNKLMDGRLMGRCGPRPAHILKGWDSAVGGEFCDLHNCRPRGELYRNALLHSELTLLGELFEKHDSQGPGTRIRRDRRLSALLATSQSLDKIAKSQLGPKARPVRALLFDKNAGSNWALGWHQDRTIVVEAKRDMPGYGPWSIKAGLIHVEPPFEVIERMVTLRAHLDNCDDTNAPLKVLPGSHRLGRLPVGEISKLAGKLDNLTCLASPGDVWLYATSIVHASDAAEKPRRRRVIQVDYAAEDLPGELRWLGI